MTLTPEERRDERRNDRRRVARGGRRPGDRPGRHPVVLVAESYAPARVPYARYLERHGFLVYEAADGEEALTVINSSPPHIILVDRALPRLSAERLSQWLSQSWRTRRIPVIVLAGSLDVPALQLFGPGDHRSGVAGVLIKPFELARMLNEVRRVIRRRDVL